VHSTGGMTWALCVAVMRIKHEGKVLLFHRAFYIECCPSNNELSIQ